MAWIDNNIQQDAIVLMTLDKTGSVTVSPKKNEKKVTFAFAADAFAFKDDVRDIAFGQTPSVAFVICKRDQASEDSIKILEDSLKEQE